MTAVEMLYNDCSNARLPTGIALSSLLAGLLRECRRQEICYCYWKSSRRIPAALTGAGDIDLIVGQEDLHRIEEILLEQGFKRFASVSHRGHPSISSFIGYDDAADQLFHVHLHARLIIGEPLLKNYRIPWEGRLLARAIFHPTLPIRMLDSTSEAVLLVVRWCLEPGRLDPVALRNRPATLQKFALDREELAARVDRASLRNLAAELMDEELAEMVADAVYGQPSWRNHYRLRRRIETHFAPYRIYSALEARVRSLARALLWAIGHLNRRFLHAPRPWNRLAPGGGRIVAVIGVDGCGKSTTVAATRVWLGPLIDVIPAYFGTGDGRSSLLLRMLKLMVPLTRRMLQGRRGGHLSQGEVSPRTPGLLHIALLTVWATAVAVEKRSKLAAAHRAASRGLIVITDRYPQDQTVSFNDGPLLAHLSRVPLWVRRFEMATYARARRLPPDLVVKLQASPGTIAKREPEMHPSRIQQRVAALKCLEFPGARVVSVDAEQPLADVMRMVKREIWRVL
jgi:hypothetical protein